jgi:electron transfer flavoprotein alpha subunit
VAARKDIACNVVELDRTRLRVRAGTQDACRPLADVMLLARGVVDADLPFVGLGHRESAPAVVALSHPGILDLGVVQGDPQSMPLEEADLILAAGNGVADLELFKTLAHELGAVVGASRVAVDKGSFARHQQIGATGKTVRARGYLAVGISGAVQHLQGIRDCRHVVAINLDAAAPIVRRADLTAVEDAGALMSALLDIVREPRAQEKRP